MDYSRFASKRSERMKPNLIRRITMFYIENPTLIPLAGGFPNDQTFPFEKLEVTYKGGVQYKLENADLKKALQYGPSHGFPPLTKLWREFQTRWHSPPREDWAVAVTTGSQEGISRIFDLFIEEGDPVMVQVPTYTATIGVLYALAPEFIGIEQDADGIVPEKIEEICEARRRAGLRQPKLLYVNPTGANPTGSLLTEERRHRIYALAQKYDFLIVEDDAYYFVNFLDHRPTSFFSLDTDGRVIRLDSFSKILSAGIRIGVISAHKDILNRLMLYIECSTLHASSLSQVLVHKLLSSWGQDKFEEHLTGVRDFYKTKCDTMVSLAEKHLSGLAEWSTPKGGMFLWIKVTAVKNVFDLVMGTFITEGVVVLPGHAFNWDAEAPDQHLRLCYSYASPEDVDKGLSIIADLIRKQVAKESNGIH